MLRRFNILTFSIAALLCASLPLCAQDSTQLPTTDSQTQSEPQVQSANSQSSPDASLQSLPPEQSFFSKVLRSFGLKKSPAKQGNSAYHKQNYDEALQKYAEASVDQPTSGILAYNAGNAFFREKHYPEAIAAYTQALGSKDAGLAARAHYNVGNAFFRKGEAAIQSGQQEGISDYREALAHYKKSLEINPDNADAKRNVEVTQIRIKELMDRQNQKQQQQPNKQKPPEPDAKAKAALARALQLAQERRYPEAMSVLQEIITEDPTAASYKKYVQRIDDVIKILKGEKPNPPMQQDPRAQQGGGVI